MTDEELYNTPTLFTDLPDEVIELLVSMTPPQRVTGDLDNYKKEPRLIVTDADGGLYGIRKCDVELYMDILAGCAEKSNNPYIINAKAMTRYRTEVLKLEAVKKEKKPRKKIGSACGVCQLVDLKGNIREVTSAEYKVIKASKDTAWVHMNTKIGQARLRDAGKGHLAKMKNQKAL